MSMHKFNTGIQYATRMSVQFRHEANIRPSTPTCPWGISAYAGLIHLVMVNISVFYYRPQSKAPCTVLCSLSLWVHLNSTFHSIAGYLFPIIIVIAWSIIPRNRSVAHLTEMINDDNYRTIYVTKFCNEYVLCCSEWLLGMHDTSNTY
ncbi:hypothetical protein BDV32DRAFT_86121 [Aspergillus pseudonomiae]|nr:hypothetical protein BDV32DRAFT_86121 [Aspergillus pseudonomiae]